ncbi:MAG: MDR/zinc-dependent alcohol dehydrogenase-like family protein [Candidatus Freyarchaeota archaeon]|nr:alcohol dehydrogenase catalytic domain-containing protein [Candidatus Freyrarchaeum guaymaensis]
MKALVFDGALRYVEDYPIREPEPGWALVKVSLAGICKTDLEITRGYMSFKGVLGHEFVGVVEKASDPELIGKRVVSEINIYCGECSFCTSGLERHCPQRKVLGIMGADGAFAEYVLTPERNLHLVPDNVEDQEAVFTEPLAACLEITSQVHVKPEWTVYVLGDGRLGLLASQVIRLHGCDTLLIGKHPEKMDVARRLGVKTASYTELPKEKADMVVECTGNPQGISIARTLVKPRGVVVAKSTYNQQAPVDYSAIVVDELSIIGSRCGPFPPAIRLLQHGLVQVKPLVTSRYPLERGLEAFKHAEDRKAIKILLKP